MPNFSSRFGEVVNRAIRSLTTNTRIRQLAAGGKARSVIETSAKEFENLSRLEESILERAFLTTAYGQFLKHFGAMVGLGKYPRRNAEALSTDRIFRFRTKLGGTFGSINGGSGFTISSGTILTSPASVALESDATFSGIDEPDNRFDRSIHYSMTADAYCASDATEIYVSAKSLTSGLGGNLASPGMIKTHNFTGYSDYLSGSLVATNVKPLLNGYDDETEASYKYRISKEITAAEKGNSDRFA